MKKPYSTFRGMWSHLISQLDVLSHNRITVVLSKLFNFSCRRKCYSSHYFVVLVSSYSVMEFMHGVPTTKEWWFRFYFAMTICVHSFTSEEIIYLKGKEKKNVPPWMCEWVPLPLILKSIMCLTVTSSKCGPSWTFSPSGCISF